MRRCSFLRPDGTACQAYAVTGREFCFFHDPELRAERLAAASRGGKGRKKPDPLLFLEELDLSDPEGIQCALGEAFLAVRSGRLDPRRGNCLALIGNALLRWIQQREMQEQMDLVQEQVDLLQNEVERLQCLPSPTS